MSDVSINYRGSSIATMDASGTKTLQTEGKYCDDDIEVVYTKPSAPPSNWTLIDTWSQTLQEFTSTTGELIDTGITVAGLGDYAFIIAVITCDTAILSSTEWGMTVHLCGRRTGTGRLYPASGAIQENGFATLSYAAMTSSSYNAAAYGVYISDNKATVQFVRKCDSSHVTKIRGGKYTVKLYGLSAL